MTKIAITSNYTIDFIYKRLIRTLRENNIDGQFYVSGFNQYTKDILDERSALYEFKPDLVFISVDLGFLCEDVLQDVYIRGYDEVRKDILGRWEQLKEQLCVLTSRVPDARVMIDNFFVPSNYRTGTLEYNSEFSISEIVAELNSALSEFQKEQKGVNIIDVHSLIMLYGEKQLFDSRLYYVAKSRWSNMGIRELSGLYLRYIKAFLGKRKKCVLLDLDDTLWGGIIGQDGIEGVSLSNDGPGKAFYDFQKELLKLYQQGILLCICSKNSEDIAMDAIEKHPYMVLKPEHFVAKRINWDNKAQNIMDIADEINLGIDSFVFLDDSPFERGLISDQVPEVLVPDMPEDPSYYAEFIRSLDVFDFMNLTREDFTRNKDYKGNVERQKAKKSMVDIESFYRSLNMKVHIKGVDEFSLPRAAQITQKTNQYNATTRRYTENDLLRFKSDGKHSLLTLSLEDKYGDSGIVGLCIVHVNGEKAYIDSFILSCRVLGRTVENAFLSYVCQVAKEHGAHLIEGEIIPTAKNMPCRDLFYSNGFDDMGNGKWLMNLMNSGVPCPEWIEIVGETNESC